MNDEHASRGDTPVDPWLIRRGAHFGASELAPLLLALGWRPADAFNGTTLKLSKRLIHRKAGASKALKVSDIMRLGSEREPEVVRQLFAMLRAGTAGPHARMIDASSVCYIEGLPESARVLSPKVDDECFRLSASLDISAFDVLGRQGVIDVKCSFKPYAGTAPRHVVQLHGQMAATGSEWGRIVEGVGYSNTWWDDKPRPIVVHEVIERNDALIEELRAACVAGWIEVERLRAQKEAA